MKEDKKDEYEIKKMVSLNLILILLQSINIGPHERHKLMFIKMTVLSSIKIILSFLYQKKKCLIGFLMSMITTPWHGKDCFSGYQRNVGS